MPLPWPQAMSCLRRFRRRSVHRGMAEPCFELRKLWFVVAAFSQHGRGESEVECLRLVLWGGEYAPVFKPSPLCSY